MRKIKVCDTTLRDCEHSSEFNMSVREKVEIAKQLERLGVDLVEVGILSDAMLEISKELKSAVFSVACSVAEFYEDDVQKALENGEESRVNFLFNSGRGSDYQSVMAGVVAESKEKGWKSQITVDALSMEDPLFLKEFCEAVKTSGADSLCVYDDTGYAAPTEFYHIVKNAIEASGGVPVSVKCKNDLGMAVANVLSAVKAGAVGVECSMNGIGKRAGNAALEQVVMGLSSRNDYYQASTNIVKRLIYRTSRMVATVVGQPVPDNQPIVGDNALTKHMAVVPDFAGFRTIAPEEVGIFHNNLLLGSHASEAVFEERVEELGYLLNAEQIHTAYGAFLDLCGRKDAVTDKDIEAIAAPLDDTEKQFELVNFVINSGTMIPSTATVIMRAYGQETTQVSVGFGPVDASFQAIDSIAGLEVALDDFSLQSVTEGEDALGDAVVKIKYGERVFTGRGVSTDIVESAIRAYINALNKVAAVR